MKRQYQYSNKPVLLHELVVFVQRVNQGPPRALIHDYVEELKQILIRCTVVEEESPRP